MARYAFLTWDGAGNQPPAVGIAQSLIERGHEVVFAGYEGQRRYFADRGLRFVVLHGASAAWRDLPAPAMFEVKREAAWSAVAHLTDVRDLIRDHAPDVLVVDCLMFGALAMLEGSQMRVAVLVHSAPGALLPPGGEFESRLLPSVNRLRTRSHRPGLAQLWSAWIPFAVFCTTVRELDPRSAAVPASFEYIGPVFERVPPRAWRSPWDSPDPRPLVLVSFSTGPYWDQRSRIERTLTALAQEPCRVLVTPGRTDVSGINAPPNAVFARDLPHALVLPHAAVTVTHAGHGTVVASLAHGVPLVCLPNAAGDQPALAAQVSSLGLGIALGGEDASPADIRAAVREVLTPSYPARAAHLAALIRATGGATTAADRLEALAKEA